MEVVLFNGAFTSYNPQTVDPSLIDYSSVGEKIGDALICTGRVLLSRKVSKLIAEDHSFAAFIDQSLIRHLRGDWGDIDLQDKLSNDEAVHNRSRLISSYTGTSTIWIITSWDRSQTVIMLPV